MAELEHQSKTPNGPVALETLSNGASDQQPTTTTTTTTATIDEERDLKEVVILEKKLEDLKSRNSVSASSLCELLSENETIITSIY